MFLRIFGSVNELDPLGFGIRAVAVGIMLWILSRYLPRRSGGQYAGYDFVFFWMMGGLLASPLFDPSINFVNAITAIVTIYFWHYALSYIVVKSRNAARMIIGKPITLIQGGKVSRQNMRGALFPLEMLLSELRTADAANPAEVETAILETSGHVSVRKKIDHQPVTPTDLGVSTVETGLPVLLVNDGEVMAEELHKRGYNESWLKAELFKVGVKDLAEVYMAIIDGSGELNYSLRDPVDV